MNQHRVPIAAGIAVLVIVAIWYVALWMPEGSKLKAARKSETQAVAQVDADQSQLALLQAQRPKIAKEETVLASLVAKLPNGPSLDQIFRTINNAADRADVILVGVSAPPPAGWAGAAQDNPVSSGPDTLQLNVSVTGSPANILRLITVLDTEPRIYVVNSFNLTPPTASETVSLDVDTYFESAVSNDPTFPGRSAASTPTPPTTVPAGT